MGRAPCCEKVGLKRGRWTAEEDEILAKYIQANGEGSWRSLPKKAGLLRCGKSCRLRWVNYLRDGLKRGNISSEEEKIIINLHASLGNRWSLIASQLPGRTDNEIKNYWISHLSRKIDTFRRPATLDAALQAIMERAEVGLRPKKKGMRTSRRAVKGNRTINVSQKGVGISTTGHNEPSSDDRGKTRVSEEVESVSLQSPSLDSEIRKPVESSSDATAINENIGNGNSKITDCDSMVFARGGEGGYEILEPLEGIEEEMLSSINEIMETSWPLMEGSADSAGDLINFCSAPVGPSCYITATGHGEVHNSVSSSNISGTSNLGVGGGGGGGGSVSGWDWEGLTQGGTRYAGVESHVGMSKVSAGSNMNFDDIGSAGDWDWDWECLMHGNDEFTVGCRQNEKMADHDMDQRERNNLELLLDFQRGNDNVSWLLS